jgi:hypothetical protein
MTRLCPWRIPWGCYLRLLWHGALVLYDEAAFAEATLPDELMSK